jgi:hypothetical protein
MIGEMVYVHSFLETTFFDFALKVHLSVGICHCLVAVWEVCLCNDLRFDLLVQDGMLGLP